MVPREACKHLVVVLVCAHAIALQDDGNRGRIDAGALVEAVETRQVHSIWCGELLKG